MSLTADDVLEHFGVKGMKWGVHNGTEKAGATRKERKAAAKESKLAYKDWKKEVGGEKVANEIFQEATRTFGPKVKIVNNDPHYKGKDLTKDRKLARQYDATISAVFNTHLAEVSVNRTMTNTGRAMIYQFDRNSMMMKATESQLVVHAAEEGYPAFKVEVDELGHIVSLTQVDYATVQQSALTPDDVLEHFGIRGMKWGVRRTSEEIKRARALPDAPEHTRARDLHTTAKAAGTRKLTNKDLQDLTSRLNLEQQYSRLTNGEKSGNKAVKALATGADWFGKRVGNVGNTLVDDIMKAHLRQVVVGKGLVPMPQQAKKG
jgi:hypothetical protein